MSTDTWLIRGVAPPPAKRKMRSLAAACDLLIRTGDDREGWRVDPVVVDRVWSVTVEGTSVVSLRAGELHGVDEVAVIRGGRQVALHLLQRGRPARTRRSGCSGGSAPATQGAQRECRRGCRRWRPPSRPAPRRPTRPASACGPRGKAMEVSTSISPAGTPMRPATRTTRSASVSVAAVAACAWARPRRQ
jgi:hypothetical protein